MAKKSNTKPSENVPHKSLSIAVGFMAHGTNAHLADLQKVQEVSFVASSIGVACVNEMISVDADLYIVSVNPNHFRNTYVNNLSKIYRSEKSTNVYYTAVLGKNKGLITELLSGHRNAEWDNICIAFDKVAFQKFANLNSTANTAYELAYLAEKTMAKNTIVAVDEKEIPKVGIKQAILGKAKASFSYYTQSLSRSWHRLAFAAIALAMLFAMPMLSRNAGISGDEFTQYEYSKLTANYYSSMLGNSITVDTIGLKGQKMVTLAKNSATDPETLATQVDPDRLMHLYGASFDTFTTLLIRWLGVKDVMDFRHMINSLFGFLCIFFGALIVHRCTGSWKYAWIALLLLFFTPRLLGESYNNPKDIPFAAGYVISIYYAIKCFGNLRVIRINSLLGLIFGTALGISIRIGGLLSIAIFFMYAGLQYIKEIGLKAFLSFKWQGFVRLFTVTFIAVMGSYICGIFPWPYGWDDLFTNPFTALKSFSSYSGSIRQLFEGKLFDSDMLPSYYLIKYVLITTPIVSLLGLLLLALVPAWRKTKFNLDYFLIFFATVFPIAYIFIQKSQVYGGLRHILFTIPFFVISGIVGYFILEEWLKEKKWAAYAVPGFALVLSLLPASFIVKNHPLEYIYFNETVGGTAGAYGNYEMDYYLAGLRPSSEWFLNNVARKNPDKQYTVLTYGMDQVKYYCRNDKNVHVGFTRYDDRSEKKWDYSIFYNAYLDKERLLGGKYPPIGTVYSPVVNGKPMGIVIKRPSFDDYEGFQHDRNKEPRLAITSYLKYLKADPNSNEVYLYLAAAYANVNRLDSAIWAAKKSLELYPEFTKSLYALNEFYVQNKEYDNAIKMMDKYLESRPKDADGHLMKAQTLAIKGDMKNAILSVQEAIAINPEDPKAYSLGSQIYQNMNDNINGGQYYYAYQLFSAKDAETYQKGLDAIKGIYLSITGKELDSEKFK